MAAKCKEFALLIFCLIASFELLEECDFQPYMVIH